MKTISLKPDRKLFLKGYLVILTITILILLTAVILLITIPLGGKTSSSQVSSILWPVTLITILVFWLISIPLTFLWIKNLSYTIEAERVSIQKGILTKMKQNIPYRAITDFMLHRSLYDRMLGMGSIRVQTAGQSQSPTGYEGNLAGLIDWDEMLNELHNRVKNNFLQSKEIDKQKEPELSSSQKILQEILNELQIIKEKLLSK